MGKRQSKLLANVEIKLPEGVSEAKVIEHLQQNRFLERTTTHDSKSLSSLLKKLLKDLSSEDARLHELFTIIIKMGLTITNLPSALDAKYQQALRESSVNQVPTAVEQKQTLETRSLHYRRCTCNLELSRRIVPTIDSRSRTKSCLLDESDNQSPAVVAEEMVEMPLDVFHKQMFLVCIDTTEFSPADKFLDVARTNLGTTSPTDSHGFFQQPIKMREHVGYHYTSAGSSRSCVSDVDSILTEAITSTAVVTSSKARSASRLKEFKVKVMKGLLEQTISSSGKDSHPITSVIKVSNEPIIRDLVGQFLMGPNSVYLLFCNWKEQPEVIRDKSGQSEPFNHEVLKWIHTIGSNAAANNSIEHEMVSTMLVITQFNEVLSKLNTAGRNQPTGAELMCKQVHDLCKCLKGDSDHICAHSVDTEPILLGSRETVEETSAPQLPKLINDNMTSFKLSPQQIMLFSRLRQAEAVISKKEYLQLAVDFNMDKEKALPTLRTFNKMCLMFSLPSHLQSDLEEIIFTDLEWLVNELYSFLSYSRKTSSYRGSRYWAKWENLLESGVMAEAIKTQISKEAMSAHSLLPSQWIFELLYQLYLFTPIASGATYFCPLYLPEKRTGGLTPYFDENIQPLYIRLSIGCITDQYTMRLFCWIVRSQILSLQKCVSRTQAVFISSKHHLRFTFSCSMNCLKITISSSFTGIPLQHNASSIVHYIISRILKANNAIEKIWYPVHLTKEKNAEQLFPIPDMCFKCDCELVPHPHLAEVTYKHKDEPHAELFMKCEMTQQASLLTSEQQFWTKHFYSCATEEKVATLHTGKSTTMLASNSTARTKIKRASSEKKLFADNENAIPRISTVDKTSSMKEPNMRLDYKQQSAIRESKQDEICGMHRKTSGIGARLHILERHFNTLYDHLGMVQVATGLMREKVLTHQEVVQILKYDTFKSTSDRSRALIVIISAVKEKGLMSLISILDETCQAYSGHKEILDTLKNDPSYYECLQESLSLQ